MRARILVVMAVVTAALLAAACLTGCTETTASILKRSSSEKVEAQLYNGSLKMADTAGNDSVASADGSDTTGTIALTQFVQQNPDVTELPAGTELAPQDVMCYGENNCFTSSELTWRLFDRINGLSYKEDSEMMLDDLRYVRVLHKDAEGRTMIGELVVNAAIDDDILAIFHELYRAGYPIEKMRLVDDYAASDEASMQDNNTSAFNHRIVQATGDVSAHGLGLAVDINPYYNPFYIPAEDYVSPADARIYIDRTVDSPYRLLEDDLCYTLFIEHGFVWGGSWEDVKDYQHFEIDPEIALR